MTAQEDFRPALHRLAYLDGLRGVAALLVVFHHFFAAFVDGQGAQCPLLVFLLTQTPLSLIANGFFCVFTFFVLSGYVLSESVAKGKRTLPSLLVARYFRLTVPMVTSLIFAWILLELFSGARAEVVKLGSYEFLQNTFSHTANVPGVFQPFFDGFYGVYRYGTSSLNDVVWTMRKELIGSFVIYFIYRFSPVKYLWLALAVFFGITLAGPVYLGFPIGAILREIVAKGRLQRSGLWSWLALIVAGFVACDGRTGLLPQASPVRAAITGFIFQYQFYAYAVGAGLLVYSILTLPSLQRLLGARLPQFLGRISFALYLVHLPLICSVILWCELHLAWPIYPKIAVLFVLLIVLAVAAAWLLTVTVDEPLTSRLHYLKRLSWKEVTGWWSRYFVHK
jgi:peptidoglycan/LPS O-acetylase OafA/YrhL